MYVGDDDLRDALPRGLWSALAAQGLVDDRTSVADLFLTVYGSEALQILADRFRDEGFNDVPSAWAGLPAAISWVRKMGFDAKYRRPAESKRRPEEFVVPGAVKLNPLHKYQKTISEELRVVLTQPSALGPGQKAMVELPTGAGKTRVATQTALRLFADEVLDGTILWIAQSAELCEQAVQTFEEVWRYLGRRASADDRPSLGRQQGPRARHGAERGRRDRRQARGDPRSAGVRVAGLADCCLHRRGAPLRRLDAVHQLLQWLGVDGRSWERPLVGLSATPFKGSASNTKATEALAARFGGKRLAAFEDDAYSQLVKLGRARQGPPRDPPWHRR